MANLDEVLNKHSTDCRTLNMPLKNQQYCRQGVFLLRPQQVDLRKGSHPFLLCGSSKNYLHLLSNTVQTTTISLVVEPSCFPCTATDPTNMIKCWIQQQQRWNGMGQGRWKTCALHPGIGIDIFKGIDSLLHCWVMSCQVVSTYCNSQKGFESSKSGYHNKFLQLNKDLNPGLLRPGLTLYPLHNTNSQWFYSFIHE